MCCHFLFCTFGASLHVWSARQHKPRQTSNTNQQSRQPDTSRSTNQQGRQQPGNQPRVRGTDRDRQAGRHEGARPTRQHSKQTHKVRRGGSTGAWRTGLCPTSRPTSRLPAHWSQSRHPRLSTPDSDATSYLHGPAAPSRL